MSPRQPKHPGALLNDTLVKHKIAVRKLARAMSELPDGKKIDLERRNVTRWKGKLNRPSAAQAERLVAAFRRLGVILPSDYFKSPVKRSPTEELRHRAAEIKRLEKRVEELERRTSG